MPDASLSIIIISHNEAEDIEACLESVSFADEIIVVDSESTDETRSIAAKWTEHVHVVPWKGFGPQKNHALDLATSDWVLSIDCDERVTERLRRELSTVLSETDHGAFTIPFRSSYCGRFMRFGEWSGERKLRLFRRGSGRFDDVPVHERIHIDGTTGRLRGRILHYSVRTRDEMRDKSRRYAMLGAEAAYESGKRASPSSASFRGSWAFVRSFLLKGGLLDGWKGLQLSIDVASATYQRHRRLAELSRATGRSN
ncbi:MAG: LPS biosynthesis protein [Phycisphaerae bacterium]|nr:LPS biosynthesis protein [Phycisphaerae bacterium]MDG1899624.1 glycosyltransferase family 2 protein [Phycisphaerales bacterium]|tara:strand:+ start:3270 stop:4034 length:765 start_codon:yes stop_codon:yes gene_type:complete